MSGRQRCWGCSLRRAAVSALLLATLAVGACGSADSQSLPSLPGGTYISTKFHFRIGYPAGWQASTGPTPSAIIPLTVEITKSNTRKETGSLVSMLSISVLALDQAGVAANARLLPEQKGMRKTTLSGLTAYADAPVEQPVPGTSVTDTHADYYLVHGAYEYQLSTDALSNDDSAGALAAMLKSFTILPS